MDIRGADRGGLVFDIHNGDCADVMASMKSNSVDAIVTDPPYGLAFMGAKWDSFNGSSGNQTISERQAEGKRYADENKGAPRYANSHGKKVTQGEMVAFQAAMTPIFEEALRVAKPGAHLLCFGGTRTFHRMTCAIEDAGWEIRDCIMWVTGQGFPKSMDVSKAIEKKHGADAAAQWDGWGTCLKPAWEPIIVARKPLDGTVAHNVLMWGVGALNIDGCRVPTGDKLGGGMRAGGAEGVWDRPFMHDEQMQAAFVERKKAHIAKGETLGRFPANLVHDGSQMVLDLFPDTGRSSGGGMHTRGHDGHESTNVYGSYTIQHRKDGERGVYAPWSEDGDVTTIGYADSGSAARFFYCAKANKKDRNYGCERFLTWAERDQELTQLLEQASNLLARDISESMMLNLVEQGCSTSLFGNENTVLSQEECRFITSTVIPLITASKTCSSSPRSNTSESILDAIRTSEESGISLARLADKSSQSRQDFTSSGTDTATSAVSALFGVLSEIRGRARVGNFHCTVKPIALMRWLVTLVTPEGGVVLDPFAGSGTTLLACKELGRSCIGIEREPEYVEIIKRRLGE